MPVGNRRSTFQRRHFDVIAQTIRNLGCVTDFQRRGIALEFALALQATNSAFDLARFVATATGSDVAALPLVATPPVTPPVTREYPDRHQCDDCHDGTPATHHCGSVYVCAAHAMNCCEPITPRN